MKKLFVPLFLIIALWVGSFVTFLYDLTRSRCSNDQLTDGIVVLTGGRGRIELGLNLLQQNKAPRLLISGVHENYKLQRIISDQMMSLIKQIELGYIAATTVENSYEAFFWAHKYNIHSFYLVTADYHMRRALLDFEMTLPNLKIYPCPVAITKVSTMSIDSLIRLSHEYNKLIVTWLRFQINKLHQ